MTTGQKILIILLLLLTSVVIKFLYFSETNFLESFNLPWSSETGKVQDNNDPNQEQQETQEPTEQPEELPKMFVNIYFIGQNKNNDEVYKIVKRSYNPDTDGSKLEFSVRKLLAGPSMAEKKVGVYSEIPNGTKLISVTEQDNKVIINLSSDFEQGGGTDGLYKRLYQLIKTTNSNTNKNVYLKINGVTAEVIGGEGIMITQPLNGNSLGE